jgi:hypothetical protein
MQPNGAIIGQQGRTDSEIQRDEVKRRVVLGLGQMRDESEGNLAMASMIYRSLFKL